MPDVKLVAVADCYNGRLDHSKELWGTEIFTTRDYPDASGKPTAAVSLENLFVHIFNGTHFIIGSKGPTRGMATGDVRFCKDSCDVPDMMLGLFDYPAEGLSISRTPREKYPGLSSGTFTEAMQEQIVKQHLVKYPPSHPLGAPSAGCERYVTAPGYSDGYSHLANFLKSVRSRQPAVEDAVFGYRAAGATLLSNLSYKHGEVVGWDPIDEVAVTASGSGLFSSTLSCGESRALRYHAYYLSRLMRFWERYYVASAF